jgi:peptide deformylase
MALRTILQDDNDTLQKVSRPVAIFNKRLHDLLDDMQETLAEANGLGLAAPQVGILRRAVLVVNEADEVCELVNPEIISAEGEQEGFEGCLSVPGFYGVVKRPLIVTVQAFDRNGKAFTMTGEAMTARCLCHEIDHLNGHLYTEYADRLYTQEELDEMNQGEDDGEEEEA